MKSYTNNLRPAVWWKRSWALKRNHRFWGSLCFHCFDHGCVRFGRVRTWWVQKSFQTILTMYSAIWRNCWARFIMSYPLPVLLSTKMQRNKMFLLDVLFLKSIFSKIFARKNTKPKQFLKSSLAENIRQVAQVQLSGLFGNFLWTYVMR